SRRRHTRWPRDWSSDVCSSDLVGAIIAEDIELPGEATPADAPKLRTKKLRAERERAENVLLVKEGDELTEEVFNRLRRQGIDTRSEEHTAELQSRGHLG